MAIDSGKLHWEAQTTQTPTLHLVCELASSPETRGIIMGPVMKVVHGGGAQVMNRQLSLALLSVVSFGSATTQWSFHIPRICNRNRKPF